ncbi:hypothetical protein C2845_PM09G05200 [Panicum miliaceum]|uniref:Uncharacterized protein n=1 Tax=Panicum miliaceum TaxID=4540 RepID=A0A3L6S1I4_PANMI|nr:hypothetical protein C2845_PM09G05200 [Panicum miliaceum]
MRSPVVSVVGEVPPHELLQPHLQARRRLVPELLPGQADVGVRVRHVAIAGHLHYVLLRLHPQVPLQDRHQRGHRHRRRVPEVEDPVRRRAALLAAGAGAPPRRVQRRQAAAHDVVDVGEVPGEVDVVPAPVHRDGLPLEDVPGEGEVGHVGAAPGPVHGEEAEPRDGEAVDVVVRVGDLLAGLLGGGVERRRLVGAVRLREGDAVVEAVDGGGGRPDDGRLRVGVLAGLEEGDEPRDVGVHVRGRVLHGVAHPSLRGEVEHVGEGHDVEELGQEAAVVDVALHDEHAVGAQQRAAGLLERRVVVGVEVVDADDAVAALAQGQRAVRAHEPGRARHQHGQPGALGGPRRPPRRRRRPDLPLPVQAAPRRGEVARRGVNEGVNAEVRGRHGHQEERPQEHGPRGREAAVDVPAHRPRPLHLHLPRRRRVQVLLQHPHPPRMRPGSAAPPPAAADRTSSLSSFLARGSNL